MPAFYLRYPHNALRFTNHVGEQRNFCKQKCDVPFLVCLSNSTLSAQRSAYFFKTLYGAIFSHTARLHKFMNNQTLPLRAGCRISVSLRTEISPSPYISEITAIYKHGRPKVAPTDIGDSLLCRKIATLFADFTLCYGIEKAVQSFFTPTPLCFILYFVILFVLFCTAWSAYAE